MNMKSTKRMMLPLTVVLGCISPTLLAQSEPELDMTMTIIEEGQGPEGLVRRIRLPSPEAVMQDQLPLENDTTGAAHLADQVESETAEMVGEAAEVLNDNIKDTLSIDGASELPGNIVDNLPEDLPLVDGITDDIDEELPLGDELPVDAPLGTMDGMMLDGVNDAADVADSIDESISDSTEEPAGIVDDMEVNGAAEATDSILEQTNDILD